MKYAELVRKIDDLTRAVETLSDKVDDLERKDTFRQCDIQGLKSFLLKVKTLAKQDIKPNDIDLLALFE